MTKKKIIALFMAMTLAFSTVACGGAASESTSTEVSKETTSIDEEKKMDVSEVVLSEYKGLTVNVDKKEVTDALVKAYAEYFFNSVASQMSWNKKAEKGETVVIDFEGKKDGVAFDGGTAQGYNLVLGSGAFIPGFEDGLIGIAPGETRDLDLTFPEEYGSAELAGQAVVFTVTCQNVIPKISDENVAALQDENFSNIEELYDYSRSLLTVYYANDYETSIITAVLDIVIGNSTIPVTPEFLAEKCEYVYSVYYEDAANYGLDVATYLSYYSTSVEEVGEVFAKRDLVFKKIAELENISFTDEEVDEYAKSVLANIGSTLTLEEEYATNDRESYRKEMITDAVYKLILENTIVEPTTAASTTDVSANEDVSGTGDVSAAE